MTQEALNSISIKSFVDAIRSVDQGGLTSHAPLGASGDTVVIYSCFDEKTSRVSRDRQLSVRLYNHSFQMLLTDENGSFIFHGAFDKKLGVNYAAEKFFEIFEDQKIYLTPPLPNQNP